MLRQVVDRLNQWIRTQPPPADWKPDPLVAGLPKPLADLPQVKDLGQMEFSRFDGYALQEAVWLRDISHWARGDVIDDLERAKSLFDWTVRNIQLEPDRPEPDSAIPLGNAALWARHGRGAGVGLHPPAAATGHRRRRARRGRGACERRERGERKRGEERDKKAPDCGPGARRPRRISSPGASAC